MANRKYNKRRSRKKSPIILAVMIILIAVGIIFSACNAGLFGDLPLGSDTDTSETTGSDIPVGGEEPKAEEIAVHIIDVGQGDAILITTESGNMLIDSGDLGNEPRAKLVNYLESHNITGFEYVVFTHTDADHIGSGDYIIQNYDVKTVIMPDYQVTTKVFGRLVDAIENKDVELILIGEDEESCEQPGYSFKLGVITHTIIAPTETFKDSNNMSIVIRSDYGETSILFTGDAEHKSEKKMVEKYTGGELDCDILKVGHHGASTSTTQEFLDAVSPDAALISCGYGNSYGHPHDVTTEKFVEAQIEIFRTDTDGSIIIKTDGITYSITTEK